MKQKRKFNCDDLARSIIERNLRGFIRKSSMAEDASVVAEDAVGAPNGAPEPSEGEQSQIIGLFAPILHRETSLAH